MMNNPTVKCILTGRSMDCRNEIYIYIIIIVIAVLLNRQRVVLIHLKLELLTNDEHYLYL